LGGGGGGGGGRIALVNKLTGSKPKKKKRGDCREKEILNVMDRRLKRLRR